MPVLTRLPLTRINGVLPLSVFTEDVDGLTSSAQHYNSTSRGNSRGWLGELLLKANPSEKDYFAVQGYTKSAIKAVFRVANLKISHPETVI